MRHKQTVRRAAGPVAKKLPKKARQQAAGDPPDDAESPEPPAEDTSAKELAALRKELKALKDEKSKAARASMSELEQIKADRDEWKEKATSFEGELGSLRKDGRLGKFRDAVSQLAPDVPPVRLRGLLRELEAEGIDIAPEVVTTATAKKALDRLRELDPDTFAPQGDPPPPPRGGRKPGDGSIDYRARGAEVAGRGPKK